MATDGPTGPEGLDRQIHELAEALTATTAFLLACERIMAASGNAADQVRVKQAIGSALEQTKRATRVLEQLRSTASRKRQLSS